MAYTKIITIDGIKHYYTKMEDGSIIIHVYDPSEDVIKTIAERLQKISTSVEISSIRGSWKVKAVTK